MPRLWLAKTLWSNFLTNQKLNQNQSYLGSMRLVQGVWICFEFWLVHWSFPPLAQSTWICFEFWLVSWIFPRSLLATWICFEFWLVNGLSRAHRRLHEFASSASAVVNWRVVTVLTNLLACDLRYLLHPMWPHMRHIHRLYGDEQRVKGKLNYGKCYEEVLQSYPASRVASIFPRSSFPTYLGKIEATPLAGYFSR